LDWDRYKFLLPCGQDNSEEMICDYDNGQFEYFTYTITFITLAVVSVIRMLVFPLPKTNINIDD